MKYSAVVNIVLFCALPAFAAPLNTRDTTLGNDWVEVRSVEKREPIVADNGLARPPVMESLAPAPGLQETVGQSTGFAQGFARPQGIVEGTVRPQGTPYNPTVQGGSFEGLARPQRNAGGATGTVGGVHSEKEIKHQGGPSREGHSEEHGEKGPKARRSAEPMRMGPNGAGMEGPGAQRGPMGGPGPQTGGIEGFGAQRGPMGGSGPRPGGMQGPGTYRGPMGGPMGGPGPQPGAMGGPGPEQHGGFNHWHAMAGVSKTMEG